MKCIALMAEVYTRAMHHSKSVHVRGGDACIWSVQVALPMDGPKPAQLLTIIECGTLALNSALLIT